MAELRCECGGVLITDDNMTETEGHGDWWYVCNKCKRVNMDVGYYYERCAKAEASVTRLTAELAEVKGRIEALTELDISEYHSGNIKEAGKIIKAIKNKLEGRK